jgi:preprotein translocase subunit SecA
LHQALEAKENVEIERESQTLASITLQNFFRLYDKLAGMSGTAETDSEEFHNIYGLDVVVVPTNKPIMREDKDDFIFLTQRAKFNAIAQDIVERHKKGQPVLIGTVAIETSELLSAILKAKGIPHEVLNAKQHEREAEIIEHAGEAGRITIATNMAGRGTDIKLTEESKKAGGLYILGTERHESRRIDNQLRGRAGRQGDPGESRFYISLEDNLIRIFAGDTLKNRMQRLGGMKEDEVIESRIVSKTIESSQEKVEKRNFEMRKHLLEYDDVLNQQRIVIYRYRKDALEGDEQIFQLIRDFIIKAVQDMIMFYAPQRNMNQEQVDNVYMHVHKLTGFSEERLRQVGFSHKTSEEFEKDCIQYLLKQYDLLRGSDTSKIEMIRGAEKWLVLETIDQAWKNHMLNLDHLKEGIGLRGWGQKNPLIEYKKEAFVMFTEMIAHIRWDIVRNVFHLKPEMFDQSAFEERREKELEDMNLSFTSAEDNDFKQVTRDEPKIGRNDMCPCGSGKKFKKCHGLK